MKRTLALLSLAALLASGGAAMAASNGRAITGAVGRRAWMSRAAQPLADR
jgi:hypothetical protein